MILSNKSKDVAQLGSNLEMCRVAFCNFKCAGTRCLALMSSDINKAEIETVGRNSLEDSIKLSPKTDSGEDSTELLGVVPPKLEHPVYRINEYRRHADCDKANADTKPKGEPEAAQAMEIRTALLILTKGGKTTTALEALRMTGIANLLEVSVVEPAGKQIRTRDWSAEEIRTLVETVEEASQMYVGPDIWGFVSDIL